MIDLASLIKIISVKTQFIILFDMIEEVTSCKKIMKKEFN